MGIDSNAVASYLVALYCSAAILTTDAIAVLETWTLEVTMSTNNQTITSTTPEFVQVPQGLPDEAEIARLAAEYFPELRNRVSEGSFVLPIAGPEAVTAPPLFTRPGTSQRRPEGGLAESQSYLNSSTGDLGNADKVISALTELDSEFTQGFSSAQAQAGGAYAFLDTIRPLLRILLPIEANRRS